MISVDLVEDGRLFGVSYRLNTASRILEKLVKKEVISKPENEHALWIADMLSAMDQSSTFHNSRAFPCVLATMVRPEYFGAKLDAAVFDTLHDKEFYDRLYQTLSSGGKDVYLNEQELRQASLFLRTFSNRVMHRLTRY
ncbi:MAG: hypothetical protein AABW46_01015 [Nanoarchaeota archaeon]